MNRKVPANKRSPGRPFHAVLRLFRKMGKGLLTVVLAITVTGGLSLIFLSLYHYVMGSPYLKMEVIDIQGVPEKIKNDLIQSCGLTPDTSLLTLDLEALKATVESHPWVRTARVERRLPRTLIIQAETERAVALVPQGVFWYVNPYGELFKPVDPEESTDLPLITGLTEDTSKRQEQIKQALCILRALDSETGPWSVSSLSEVHVGKDQMLSVYFTHFAAEILLTCEGLPSRLKGLTRVVNHLTAAGQMNRVIHINLNYTDGAVVRFKKA